MLCFCLQTKLSVRIVSKVLIMNNLKRNAVSYSSNVKIVEEMSQIMFQPKLMLHQKGSQKSKNKINN